MNCDEINDAVTEALRTLRVEQPELFDSNVAERAIAHHLANCLRRLMPDFYHVDVEYNRVGTGSMDRKRLDLPRRHPVDDELVATTVFPDIIVHARGTNANNLAALEIKKAGENIDYDELKLRAFRDQLEYRHVGHVILPRHRDDLGEVRWL